MANHPILFAGIGLVAVACILQAVSVATPAWLTFDTAFGSANTGLWKLCGSNPITGQACVDITDPTDWVKAVRAFGILAILVMLGAAVVGALVAVKQDMAKMVLIPPALAIAGMICSVLGFAIFAAKATENSSEIHFGYSFILSIVAAVLAGASGACFFIGKKYIQPA